MNAIDVAKKADKFVDLAYKWVQKSWGFKAEAEYARMALRDALIEEFSANGRMEAQDAEMDEAIEREMAEEAGDVGDRAWSVFNICAERDAAVAERDELRAKLAAIEAGGEPVAWLHGLVEDGQPDFLYYAVTDPAKWAKPSFVPKGNQRYVIRPLYTHMPPPGAEPLEEYDIYEAMAKGTPLYTHPAPLPDYVAMTDAELHKAGDEGVEVWLKARLSSDGPEVRATFEYRAIEQAVLARLGVKP